MYGFGEHGRPVSQQGIVQIRVLDGFSIVSEGGAIDLPHRAERLLAYLAVVGSPRSRSSIAGSLWPEMSEQQAQARLRSALWRVRRARSPLIKAQHYGLALDHSTRVDSHVLLSWARSVLDSRTDCGKLDLSPEALSGDLLPGWYDDWANLERESLRQIRLQALELIAERFIEYGRFGEAVQAAYAAMVADPLRESARRVLIRLHLAQGNLAEAAVQYDAFRSLLRNELGIEPTHQIRDLVAGLRHRNADRRRGVWTARTHADNDQATPRG